MTWQDMAAILDCEAFSARQGMPLTAFVTVNWKSAPGFDARKRMDWEKWHRRFTETLSDWMKPHAPVAFLYVRERGAKLGAHTHFVVHLPSAPASRWIELKPKLEKQLKAACKRWGFTDPRAVDVTGDKRNTPGMIYPSQRHGLLRYLAKAVNPEELIATGAGKVALHKMIGIRPRSQLPLPCKRVGWTQNIGEATRRAAGWEDIEDVLRLAEHIPEPGPDNNSASTGKLRTRSRSSTGSFVSSSQRARVPGELVSARGASLSASVGYS
jgi:hypothetical protein